MIQDHNFVTQKRNKGTITELGASTGLDSFLIIRISNEWIQERLLNQIKKPVTG